MLKQLMISKKIEQRKAVLAELEEQERGLETRAEQIEAALAEAQTDEEIATVEEEVSKIEAEKEELKQKKANLEAEIAELESELEQLNSKAPKNNEGGKRDMSDKLEVREVINDYVRTKQIRQIEGFKVVDGGVLVPERYWHRIENPKMW